MARESKIRICKGIKLDKTYNNVLNYSEANLLALCESNSHLVASANDYSFIRARGTISVNFTYSQCLQANYMAFQNKDYDNKWFFAFIDDVTYISDGCTEISYTIDAWQTFFNDWTAGNCFVIREHTNNDTIGANTIPENIETGEYICNSHYKDTTMDSYATDLCFIMASTSEPISGEAKDTVTHSSCYNGIYTGLTYFRYDTTTAIDLILEIFANSAKLDAINGIFMAPKWLASYYESGVEPAYTYKEVLQSNSPSTFTISVAKQATINGYTPKNNKVKCFPYNYLLVSNNIGQNAILHYEKFSDASNATFTVKGVLNPGCSINLTPTNYNGNTSSDIDAIQLGKFPICNYQNDMYTNWLTQNSVNVLGATITSDDMNIASSAIGGVASTATGIATGNYLGAGISAVNGTNSVIGAIMQKKQHNMIPATISGQLNSADINVASGNNTFHFYKMSVKAEYARCIDEYFTKYGYQTNRVKTPNITGRTYWNYIEIGSNDVIGHGNVPNKYMDIINNIARKGVTIWHNHDNIGNYSLNHTIVS